MHTQRAGPSVWRSVVSLLLIALAFLLGGAGAAIVIAPYGLGYDLGLYLGIALVALAISCVIGASVLMR